ncbi:MAG: glycosyltransferase [Flavobacteriia bacterium]|nr:MAG: glycosyltransferase [Flavobacteriia bacterium]
MKVLHLIDSGGLYGAEKMLLSLVEEQLTQGLEPMILSAGETGIDEKPLEAAAKEKGLPLTPWRMKSGLNLKESWNILKWAQANNFELLHSHGFKFNVLLGIYPERFRHIPMIATLHGYLHAPCFSKLWVYETLDRLAIHRMRGVVLVGEAMKKELPTGLSGSHAVVIPNGLNISELQESALTPLEEPFKSFFAKHDIVILGVGRLSPEKGFDRLICAFSELKKRLPNSGLVIVGEGGLRQELEALIDELGISHDALMPGYCNAVPALLKHSKVLVMPSLTEGLPITLLEAMALKTPVVASDVGEISRVLCDGQGGEILGDVKPETILRAVKKSLAEKGLSNRRVNEAYLTVCNSYSSKAMADGYIEFYNKIFSI